VLADGTTMSAGDLLARPAETVDLAACQSNGNLAAALAQVVPAGGQAAQAAVDPNAVLNGGHFESVFATSLFDGLGYGNVGPLAFGSDAISFDGRGLLRTTTAIIDVLGLGTNESDAFIPFPDKPVFAPGGQGINTDALIANEGISVYLSGLAGVVGIPDARNLSVATDPLMVVTLQHDGAAFHSMAGFYELDASGHITTVDLLWLNASLDAKGNVTPDFFGQVANQSLTVTVPPDTHLGFFLIADGGGDGSLTGAGPANQALFQELFAQLKLDPTASWQANLDAINAHLHFDAATGHIEVETDPGVFQPLVGDTYFSQNPALNSDFRTDLSLTQNAHTVSGVSGGLLWIGFEDFPFRGDIHTQGGTDLNPGPIASIGGADLDYNDLLFSVDLLYPPGPVTPGMWHPTTEIFNSLSQGLGEMAQATFTISGLNGDGVALGHPALSPGWTLTPGANVDAFGNGTYTLTPPGGASSSTAMIAELNKIEINVPGDPHLVGRPAVNIDFTVVDTHGLSDTAAAHLAFTQTGPSPPAPPDVQIHETFVPPPTVVTLHETFG
jgi:hypothetical protein